MDREGQGHLPSTRVADCANLGLRVLGAAASLRLWTDVASSIWECSEAKSNLLTLVGFKDTVTQQLSGGCQGATEAH